MVLCRSILYEYCMCQAGLAGRLEWVWMGGNPGVHCVGAMLAEWMELEKIKAVGVEGGSSRCTGLELPHQDR